VKAPPKKRQKRVTVAPGAADKAQPGKTPKEEVTIDVAPQK